MSENNPNEITFSQFCAFFGYDSDKLLSETKYFVQRATEEDHWQFLSDDMHDCIISLLNIMTDDLFIPEDLLVILQMFAQLMATATSHDDMPSMAANLEQFPADVQALINTSIALNEAAEGVKAELCKENNGPFEFPPSLVYITTKPGGPLELDFNNITTDNYLVHTSTLEIFNSDEGFESMRGLLAEAFEHFGAPLLLGLTCDTYMREFDSAEEATSAAGRAEIENMEELFVRPGNNICQAIASIVMAKGVPAVTAVSKYSYDDSGQPDVILGGASYTVNPVAELLEDPSHRGQVCALFASYLSLGEIIS